MKNPEWYNDLWRKKLNELPVKDDPSSAWQQMQRMLNELPPAGDGLPKPGAQGVHLFKIISYVVATSLLTAVLVYKVFYKRDKPAADHVSSVKVKPASPDHRLNQPGSFQVNRQSGLKDKATIIHPGESIPTSVKSSKANSVGFATNKDSADVTARNIIDNASRTSHHTAKVTEPISSEETVDKTTNLIGRSKGRSWGYKVNIKVDGGTGVAANITHTHRGKRPSQSNSDSYPFNQSVYSAYPNRAIYQSKGIAFIPGRDTMTLSVSGQGLCVDGTGYDALLKQNSSPTVIAMLNQQVKLKGVNNGGNGGGFSKIDMMNQASTGGSSVASKRKKTGGENYPKRKKPVAINTPKYNYGAYMGLSNGTTNASANLGVFGAYALSNRWLINTGVYLNTSRSFSGAYTHQSFYRPDSLPSFTINDFRKAVAITVPLKLEYKVMNLLSIKAGPLLSFTGSQKIVTTTYSIIKDRRDTLKHGTELNTALNGTKVSKIAPGFEAGLSFHFWKLDIDGRYQWLAPYTINGTLGSYRNKYRAIDFGIGYRFR